MDRGADNHSSVICKLCGEAFALPENEADDNLPQVLFCGHIFCASCLLSIQCDSVIRCPECERADMEKIEKTVDEGLAQAAENLAQLEHIHETLTAGLAEQMRGERARLEMEIKQAADKALHAIHKWKDVQLRELTKLEAQFSASQSQVCCVQERIKTLKIAMQMAREVRRVPLLEQYCILDKVLETLQAPVDNLSSDLKCPTVGSGVSWVFQSEESEGLNQGLSLSLKMEVSKPKHTSPSRFHQLGSSTKKPPRQHAEGRNLPTPLKQDRKGPGAPFRGSFQVPRSRHNSASSLGTPDVIIEELFDDGQLTQWVVVTHIVNPNHFYIRYMAEERENKDLSKKINHFCCRNTSDSMIFVKWEGLWFRARLLQVSQKGCVEAVKACLVDQLASIRVFFLDSGLTKSFAIQSEEGTIESSLIAVNNHLRKVCEAANLELGHFASQAIRCSLNDLVPYDPTKGWSEEAKVEFHRVVGSSAVEMRALGQDRDSLLVDLKKAPMDQSSDVPISVREYLVFIEVARFSFPVTLGNKPLLYYPPVCPKLNTELNAVVSHINSPADFYIQLVDNMESLLLAAKLQDCYNAATVAGGDDLSVRCPVIGQAYVAHYDDKLWYRAQVTGLLQSSKVEVCYVDFGNKKILSVSDLRKIKDEFFALPCIAIHCCLSDVIPVDGDSWSEACTNRFISLAHQKLVTVVATETAPKTEPLPVKLFESSLNGPLANIAELLVKEELASFAAGLNSKCPTPVCEDSVIWDPPLELGLTTRDVDDPDQILIGEQSEQLLDLQPLLMLSAQLKDLKVRVSHVNSPSSFYVQLTQYDPQLKRMFELVKQECARVEAPDVAWKADMRCAALINSVWERGQITSDVTSSNIAEVMRCDYGNKVKLHVSNLRPLPSSLIGSLALECTLTDIRPAGGRPTWTATACDLISDYLDGASALMTIKELTDERPVPVTLLCSNKMGQFISMADFLTGKGLAFKGRKPGDAVARCSESKANTDGDHRNCPPAASLIPFPPMSPNVSTTIPPKTRRRTIMSVETVKTQLYRPAELPCLGHVQMNVSAVGEDGNIYARTQNAECQLEQLRGRIQQSLKTLPQLKPYTWKSVLGCSIIGADMLWYRGQLLEVQAGQVTVQYVDYGLVENIPVVHVYPMLLCDDVPQLCIPCRLHSINPVGGRWQADAVALLREMLLNRWVDIQVVELPTDPRGPITVELFLDGLSLNRILCHHKHASVDLTVPAVKEHSAITPDLLDVWDISTEGLRGPEEPMPGPFICPKLPQEGKKFQVRIKHLVTPNELFLWPLEGTADVKVDQETLEEALSRVNANIRSLPRLSNFPHGGPCLAQYSDGKYYRAKLIKIASVEPVTVQVQHVDFGSDDTLPSSKLRQMPAELLAFPTQALKVKVAGFKAPRVSSQEGMLPYSPRWSLKATMDMIDLLHSNITASVVAQEPELTVLLYNQDGQPVHLPLVSRGLAELE